jgi:hypothetical protein
MSKQDADYTIKFVRRSGLPGKEMIIEAILNRERDVFVALLLNSQISRVFI